MIYSRVEALLVQYTVFSFNQLVSCIIICISILIKECWCTVDLTYTKKKKHLFFLLLLFSHDGFNFENWYCVEADEVCNIVSDTERLQLMALLTEPQSCCSAALGNPAVVLFLLSTPNPTYCIPFWLPALSVSFWPNAGKLASLWDLLNQYLWWEQLNYT